LKIETPLNIYRLMSEQVYPIRTSFILFWLDNPFNESKIRSIWAIERGMVKEKEMKQGVVRN
jgi:hypothetical protein